MACRGRTRLPEVRRRQGKRGTGPDQPDLRSRRVRRGISAESGGARRKHRQLRLCRRKPSAARQYRQPAALADFARAGGSAAARKPSGKLSTNPIRSRRRGSRPMPRHRTARFHCPRRASPRRRMTPICRPRARRHRAAAIRLRAIPRARLIRRLQLPIRNQPMRSLQRRRRGSGPRREMPSAPSVRSR